MKSKHDGRNGKSIMADNFEIILDKLNKQFDSIDHAIKVFCQYQQAEINRMAKEIGKIESKPLEPYEPFYPIRRE